MKKLFLLVMFFFASISIANAQVNLITNGDFEEDVWPSKMPGSAIFGQSIAYSEPLRLVEYFQDSTELYYPFLAVDSPVKYEARDGVWYVRNVNFSYVRSYVDELSKTPYGSKCLTLHNTKYEGSSERNWQASTPFQHVLFQRVSLDNSMKYELKFSYQKRDSLLASSGDGYRSDNYATRFIAGIVSSTQPYPQDFTYVVDIPIPLEGDQAWKDTRIILDLLALIEENDVLDFFNSAIIFGLQTDINPLSSNPYSMLPGQISIDNVRLFEYEETSVPAIDITSKFSIINRKLIIKEPVRHLKVFDLVGNLLHNKDVVFEGQVVYTFKTTGIYLIQLDGVTRKVVVN